MEKFKLSVGYGNFSYRVNGLYVVKDPEHEKLLMASFFERSAQTVRSAIAQIATGSQIECQGQRSYRLDTLAYGYGEEYRTSMTKVPFGRDSFWVGTVVNKRCDEGGDIVITDPDHVYGDLYDFLMKKYKLRLKSEWIPAIERSLREDEYLRLIRDDFFWFPTPDVENPELRVDPRIQLHGAAVRVDTLMLFDASRVTQDRLDATVSDLIANKVIEVADMPSKPLRVETVDPYIERYGKSIVDNLEKQIETLAPLDGSVPGFVAKKKRLFPQQGACINGVEALMSSGSRYGMLCEGMGCGKTIQGAASVDNHFNLKWLKDHPGKSLKDMYRLPAAEQPKYRVIMMAPSHLTQKWKAEIESEVPGAKATVVDSFAKLTAIRDNGRERTGREWFLFSKDFAKLGAQFAPIPVKVAARVPEAPLCIDCLDNDGDYVYAKELGGKKRCPKCGGSHFRIEPLRNFVMQDGEKRVRALLCPHCGKPLIKYSAKYDEVDAMSAEDLVLRPGDFADHNEANDHCFNCGQPLWGVDVKNVGQRFRKNPKTGLPEEVEPVRRWYKATHFKNHQKKSTKTVWVLKGEEESYKAKVKAAKGTTEGWTESKMQVGPRKWAPSLFIKKKLKGFFDVCVLDEAHKYEGGGTAQSLAAHAMMKASKFTLCLTGTITNGRADSLFYLLYMLDPRRMKSHGFSYGSVMDFARKYGSIVSRFELKPSYNGTYNSNSRGRQIGRPKIGPGISPLLFTDFLLDKAIFLDLSDLSKYLPPLKEMVEVVKTPDEVKVPYNYVVENLKMASQSGGGMGLLSNMLQFGLSYPDKPYGRSPIMHPFIRDSIVTQVPAVEEYQDGKKMLPKEERLVEIVNSEVGEGRNCFIYCSYTGNEELNITSRLKELVEKRCNLKGSVCVMKASSPEATKREAYIQKKAAEGIKVFICNMKLVETGLDFCFKYDGVDYNYPTIIFYQLTYELSVMWQASRRHYRLNQNEECRTYYLVAEDTLQTAAVKIMAEKQVAASAIQGKFSAEGLASMASGVDPKLKLAQALSSKDDGTSRESLENMFDVMNHADGSEDERYKNYVPPMTYYELMGEGEEETETVVTVVTKTPVTKPEPIKVIEPIPATEQISIFDLFSQTGPVVTNPELLENEKLMAAGTKRKPKKEKEGQLTLFNFLGVETA